MTMQTMRFEIEGRENMFAIVDKIIQDSGSDEQSATRLGVSIRLLGPLMMQDRKHPLFVDFMPHFRNFMQNLKKTLKARSACPVMTYSKSQQTDHQVLAFLLIY